MAKEEPFEAQSHENVAVLMLLHNVFYTSVIYNKD